MSITYPGNSITYIAWHVEAERRIARGERQERCPECRLWVFPKWKADRDEHKRRCQRVKAYNKKRSKHEI